MKAKIAKALASPSPIPTPLNELSFIPLYKAVPFLQVIPENVIWAFIGGLFTIIVNYLYRLVTARRVMTVKIAMMTELHKNQETIERLLRAERDMLEKKHTDQMIAISKLNNAVDEMKYDVSQTLKATDDHSNRLHKVELRVGLLEHKIQ